MNNLKIVIIILTFFTLVLLQNQKSTQLLEKYSEEDILSGIITSGDSIYYQYYPLTTLEGDSISFCSLFSNNNNIFIATCSPYICGGCLRTNLILINDIAKSHNYKVYLIMSNWYMKDTMDAIHEINISEHVQVLLDNKGLNIANFANRSSKFTDMWFFVLSENNYIQYMKALNYESNHTVQSTDSLFKLIIEFLD